MSHIDEITTSRLGWPTIGPIQQEGDRRRAAICFGERSDRHDRSSLWLESREELIALINAASHQLSCWEAMDRQRATAAHPSHLDPAPLPPRTPTPAPAPAPAPEPAPSLSDLLAPPLSTPFHHAPAPMVRGPFDSATPPLPSVESAVPVPPSVTAMAAPDAEPPRGVRPYLMADPQEAGRQQEAVMPDPSLWSRQQ
ncbi:hypothetical protein ACLQ2R_03345 [Streptosporangium sp. DT93]|uniref:hypothetical protein n=1 Tax=Streptosporangium sp. DT93 TaxID=3393428 RepID=UPI003CF04C59